MYIHVCQNELCPQCKWWGCYCQMQLSSGSNYISKSCPNCGHIFYDIKITSSNTENLNDLNDPKGNLP